MLDVVGGIRCAHVGTGLALPESPDLVPFLGRGPAASQS